MKPVAKAPTDQELKKGPVVVLTRPGWGTSSWQPHGFAYPIRFEDRKATILESHFDEWVGDGYAEAMGITVTRPKPKPKVQSKPKETTSTAAQKAAAKKPARKKAAPKK